MPFPKYGYVPGGDVPHPRHAKTEHVPELGSDDAGLRLAYGADLYHHGYLWEAHEVWESAWIEARGHDANAAAFWQGLIWNAAAQLKVRAENWRGAASLSRKSRAALGITRDFATAHSGGYYLGIDLCAFIGMMDAHYATLWAGEREGISGNPPRLKINRDNLR